MKAVAIGFAAVVVVFGTIVAWNIHSAPGRDLLDIGTFVILAFTLIALVVYAYDTNSIARVTRERWKREGVLATTYEMGIAGGSKGDPGRTLFRLHNPSKLMVRAKVNCNFRVYGDPVDTDAPYDGREIWYVFPQQVSQGWFEIESLVQRKGKTVAAMMAERTSVNASTQLTMDLEMEFRDELGERRTLPARRHYFDFHGWTWVPVLTKPAAWD